MLSCKTIFDEFYKKAKNLIKNFLTYTPSPQKCKKVLLSQRLKKLSSTNTKSKSSAKHIVKLRGLNSIVFQKSYEKSYNDFHNILTT